MMPMQLNTGITHSTLHLGELTSYGNLREMYTRNKQEVTAGTWHCQMSPYGKGQKLFDGSVPKWLVLPAKTNKTTVGNLINLLLLLHNDLVSLKKYINNSDKKIQVTTLSI